MPETKRRQPLRRRGDVSIGETIGRITEARVSAFFRRCVTEGILLQFVRTERFSPEDFRGFDFFVEFAAIPGTFFPVQVKSSRGGLVKFREKHGNIPILVAGKAVADAELRRQLQQLEVLCRAERGKPKFGMPLFRVPRLRAEAKIVVGEALTLLSGSGRWLVIRKTAKKRYGFDCTLQNHVLVRIRIVCLPLDGKEKIVTRMRAYRDLRRNPSLIEIAVAPDADADDIAAKILSLILNHRCGRGLLSQVHPAQQG